MSDRFLSVKEASEMLDCSEQYVRKLLRYGELSGEKISTRCLVTSESVGNYQYQGEDSSISFPDRGRRSFNKPNLKALSFFSGCMGLDLGLESAGIFEMFAKKSVQN